VNAIDPRPAQRYRCRCDHVFQVFGLGRHRRFYELDDLDWAHPAIARLCPSRQLRLPTTRRPGRYHARPAMPRYLHSAERALTE
jgi:hypothetical protein